MYQHGSNLPGITTAKKPKRMALDSVQLGSMRFGGPILIKSGTTDSGHTGATNTLRPGTMVAAETGGTGYYVPVSDWASVAKGTAGAITSLIAGGATTQSKILKLFRNGVQVASVTFASDDNTTSKLVTALNGNASFRNHAVASGADGAALVITDVLGIGALTAEIDLDTFFAIDIGTSSIGHAITTHPDVRVIGEEVGMRDANGEAIAGHSSWNFEAGLFRASHLIVGGAQVTALTDIPAWARAVLEARGSTFVL